MCVCACVCEENLNDDIWPEETSVAVALNVHDFSLKYVYSFCFALPGTIIHLIFIVWSTSIAVSAFSLSRSDLSFPRMSQRSVPRRESSELSRRRSMQR